MNYRVQMSVKTERGYEIIGVKSAELCDLDARTAAETFPELGYYISRGNVAPDDPVTVTAYADGRDVPSILITMPARDIAPYIAETAEGAGEPVEPSEPAADDTAAPAAEMAPDISDNNAGETVEPAADDAARAVPEKTFVGTSINGAGYSIHFDDIAGRTRLTFDHEPNSAELALINKYRFFYSPNLECYVKKLTFKAYRAAVNIAAELDKLHVVKGDDA